MTSNLRHWLPISLFTIVAYLVLGKICLALGTIGGTASPFWLPAGLVAAMSLRFGYWALPGIFLGEFLLGVFFMPGLAWKHLMIASGNVLEGAAVFYLASRWMRGENPLGSVRNFFVLFGAAAVGSAFNALLGVGSLVLSDLIPLAAFGSVMLTWSTGDLGGVLIVAPLLLSWSDSRRKGEWPGAWQRLEVLALIVASCGLTWLIFSDLTSVLIAPLAFLLLPFLLWSAFRFGLATCSLVNALMMLIVIWGTTHGHGPFVASSPTESLMLIQLFTSVLIATSLLVLIVNQDRQAMTERLRRDAERLEESVKQRTSELNEALLAAKAANQAKSEFLSNMSHELRTPMNSILGFAQILSFDDKLQMKQRDHVNGILRGGRHLLDLINEVLDLGQIESGHLQLFLEPVLLGNLIEECLRQVEPLAQARKITLSHDAPAAIAVNADRIRLVQVLLNLLSNAIKYNREGGRVTLDVQAVADGGVRLSVADTGIGIASDRLPKLFTPFTRLETEYSGVEGTGIGLTITLRLVKAMNGAIGVDSQFGVGTTFWIELPGASAVPSEATVEAALAEPSINVWQKTEKP